MLAIGSAHAGKRLTHAELLERMKDPDFRKKFNGQFPDTVVYPDVHTAHLATEFERAATCDDAGE